MKLRSLAIHALPGIDPGFVLDVPAPGLNLVVGPNASGKSSLGRALRALLGPERDDVDGPVHLEAEFADGGGRLRVARTGPQVRWERDGVALDAPPPLPEPRFLRCFVIDVDTLAPGRGAGDEEIERRIATELSGGYDLGAVRALFEVKRNHAMSERRALRQAETGLAAERAHQESVAREEAALEALVAELAAAEAAGTAAARCAKALELIDRREALAQAEARLGGFPAGMDALLGNEAERLDQLDEQARTTERERERASARLAAAREEQDAAGAENADPATLREAEHEHRTLERREETALDARRGLEEAEAALGEARAALGDAGAARLDPGSVARAEQSLDHLRKARADRAAVGAELDLQPAPVDRVDVDRLRAARADLLAWLSAPAAAPRRVSVAVLVAAAAVLGLSLLGALAMADLLVEHRLLGALALGVVAFAVAGVVLALRPGPGAGARASARARYERREIGGAPGWSEDAVAVLLDEIDGRIRAVAEANRASARRGELEARQERFDAALAAAERAARELAEDVGFDVAGLDASLARWIALAARHDAAREGVAAARASLDAALRDAAGSRLRVVSVLTAAGERAPAGDAPAGVLAAALERLRERVIRREHARRQQTEAREALGRARERLEALGDERAKLLDRAGLPADGAHELRARAARFAEWRDAKAALDRERLLEAERAADLGDDAALGPLVDAGDRNTIEVDREAALAAAGRRDELAERIGRVREKVEQVTAGSALERARAAERAALDALGDRLEEALRAHAGSALLEQVEHDHVATSRPAVLARAETLFATFTRHRFALGFDAGSGRFTARDNEAGATRVLAELSSGTRMQLLLAARIAFAEEVEPAGPLPLFLDEALTTADPERHRAAAACMGAMVSDEGRQVFYLTAQPQDVAFWAEHACVDVAVHDLGVIRGAAAPAGALAAAPAPARAPDPAGMSPQDYAVAIGAPRDDPWSPAAGVHLFHVLRDDLPALRRLLDAGVERAGALRALLDSPAASLHLDDAEQARARWRLDALDAHREAWRRGRGRPLEIAALAGCAEVGAAFVAPVSALLERCAGDAGRLLEAIDGREIKRFRSTRRDALEEWLRGEGYLGDGPVLDAFGRRLAVESRVIDAIESDTATVEEVGALVRALEAAQSP